MIDNEDYTPRNREKAKQAKYGWSWCWVCDRQIVSDGIKCPICGHRHKPNKIRYE